MTPPRKIIRKSSSDGAPSRKSLVVRKKTAPDPVSESQSLIIKKTPQDSPRQSRGLLVKKTTEEDSPRQSRGLLKKTPQDSPRQSRGLLVKKTTEEDSPRQSRGLLKKTSSSQNKSQPIKVLKAKKDPLEETAWDSTYIPKLKGVEKQRERIQNARTSLKIPTGIDQFLNKSTALSASQKIDTQEQVEEVTFDEVEDSRGYLFCTIPNGIYSIGAEKDPHKIRHPFSIAKYALTKAEFFEFVAETELDISTEQLSKINAVSPTKFHPAVNISWEDATAFCRWLSSKTGDYYTLPSSEEWEIAARGSDASTYPWGEEDPEDHFVCFNSGTQPETTVEVHALESNCSPFGVIGMIGNVMEWTSDSFDDDRDPHILRGGSWKSPIDFCNSFTPCLSFPPEKRADYMGMRLLYIPADQKEAYLASIDY